MKDDLLTIDITLSRRVTTTIYSVGHANSISALYAEKLFDAVQNIMGLTSANNTLQIEILVACVVKVGFRCNICSFFSLCFHIFSLRAITEEGRAFVDILQLCGYL